VGVTTTTLGGLDMYIGLGALIVIIILVILIF